MQAAASEPTTPAAKRAISQRKLEANQRNAQKSTGPRTARGKAISSKNAAKTLLVIDPRTVKPKSIREATILPGEPSDDFIDFHNTYIGKFRPVDDMEIHLVKQMAHNDWNLRCYQAARIEALQLEDFLSSTVRLLDRYIAEAQRTRGRLMRDLRNCRSIEQEYVDSVAKDLSFSRPVSHLFLFPDIPANPNTKPPDFLQTNPPRPGELADFLPYDPVPSGICSPIVSPLMPTNG